MKNKLIILILSILSFPLFSHAKPAKQTLMRDGIILKGIVGKLISDNNDGKWFFELISPVTENGIVIDAGKKIELLPSSSLEMMIDSTKTFSPATFQLWNAKVTKYDGKNYIFPSMFIPVRPVLENQTPEKADSNEPASEEIKEPGADSNDILSLPPEIMEQFNQAKNAMDKTGQRIPESNFVSIDDFQKELERKRLLNPDTVILDEDAILSRNNKGEYKFTLDTLGRNIDSTSFHLLPCETLEQTELIQASNPEILHFQISGIVTKYKGEKYLLLYKATQIYNYGNLGR